MEFALLLVLLSSAILHQSDVSAATDLDVEAAAELILSKRDECGGKADFVFLVDESGSVSYNNFQLTKEFVKGVINQFTVGPKEIQFGFVTYGTNVRNQFNLNEYSTTNELMRAIDAVSYRGGWTDTAAGLAFVSGHSFSSSAGGRNDVPKVAIVITDGQSNDKAATARQAQLAKAAGVVLLAIGVGRGVDINEINGIGSDPKDKYVFKVPSFEALKTMQGLVSKTVCEEACLTKEDFVFLLDESNSVGNENFEIMKTFVKNIIKKFDVGPDDIQFGFVTYGSQPKTYFDLNRYKSSSEIMKAIDAIKFGYGYTRTAEALAYLVSHCYIAAAGARDDVPRIAVVVTDGLSTNKTATRIEARRAKAAGITILAVGVGASVDDKELDDIASDPDSRYRFKVDSFEDLESIQDLIAETACRGDAKPPTN